MYQALVGLPRWAKSALVVLLDMGLIAASLYLAFALRIGVPYPAAHLAASLPLFPILPVAGAGVVIWMGLHRIKLSAFETSAVVRVGHTAALLTLLAFSASHLMNLSTPRSVPLIFGLLFFLGAVAARLGCLRLLDALRDRKSRRERVIVYGAGAAGLQLVSALRSAAELRPVAFVDDNAALAGMTIGGLPVHHARALEALVRRRGIDRVLLAIPSLGAARRREIAARLAGLPVKVQVLPSVSEMIAGASLVDSLRTLSPDDLLGRNAVNPELPEVARTYHGRTVMVTGAGGSIGSELCRQILKCRPARLVLLEISEFALYRIGMELGETPEAGEIEIVPALGSVADRARVDRLIADNGVDVIVHAAAYKHVPLVEANEIEGIRNNVLGTLALAEAARAAKVERFIMISTDKAVRPTSVMGATKRMAEIALQDLQKRAPETKFALVRFGNVLGSSGSVIPLFKEQIAKGGPVTVTHNEVTRFFMTISEAVGLVLLAGAFARGGDVFVLDMGRPMRIRDLAERMIALAGRTVRDAANPAGDIEIREIGLRPGEKLYEELLIDEDMLPTPHEKILRAQEGCPSEIEVARLLRMLDRLVTAGDAGRARAALAEMVAMSDASAEAAG